MPVGVLSDDEVRALFEDALADYHDNAADLDSTERGQVGVFKDALARAINARHPHLGRPPWRLDVEHDTMGPAPGNPKEPEKLGRIWDAIRGTRWSFNAGIAVEPDIVLHQRRSGTRDNEIVCEAKRLRAPLGSIAYDTAKLIALGEDVGYCHPILLVLGKRRHTSRFCCVRSVEDARRAIEAVEHARDDEDVLDLDGGEVFRPPGA